MVSDHNATDKTPMCEMPQIFMFEVLGLGRTFFCIDVLGVDILSLAFCAEITVDGLFWAQKSVLYIDTYFWKQKKVYPICNGSEEG